MNASAGKQKARSGSDSRPTRKEDRNPRTQLSTPRQKREKQPSGKHKQSKASSCTTFYDRPLEILDVVLQKSYLHWILNLLTKQRDEEVIRSLTSVDVCFNRRFSRQRFKKTIFRYLKDFYTKTKKRSTIIRSNRNYLLENIQPNDELLASLLSLNYITEEQSHFIQRQHSTRDKNDELLYVVESFDETKFSNFVQCLRQTNQKQVAKIMEHGGGVIKIEVQTHAEKYTTSMEVLELIHQNIKYLRNRTKPRSHKIDQLLSQLKYDGIEILNSQLDRQTVLVWIWCCSQSALENIQTSYESNKLIDVLFENILPSISKVINIDRNEFQKIIVLDFHPISIDFIERIEIPVNDRVLGVTKLRNEIYILCRSRTSHHAIRVFEDRTPFHLHKEIQIKEITFPFDIGSCEQECCLYICDSTDKCVWKITREADYQHEIIKWLTTNYEPSTLSVSSGGHLLLINNASTSLMFYGPDAELVRLVILPEEIKNPQHAVETSVGNIIIIHSEEKELKKDEDYEDEEEREEVEKMKVERRKMIKMFGVLAELKDEEEELMELRKQFRRSKVEKTKRDSGGRRMVMKLVLSELTRDGQMVIRRFIPSGETEQLNEPCYLSLDSDDRVFVADRGKHRVFLLDSDLKWNRILCPTKEGKGEIWLPFRLCYDEEMKLLIVGGVTATEVNVYTLRRN